MDDTDTVGRGIKWLKKVMEAYDSFEFIGLHTVKHQCVKVKYKRKNGKIGTQIGPSMNKCLNVPKGSKVASITINKNKVPVRQAILAASGFSQKGWPEFMTRCDCKAKSALITSIPLNSKDISRIDKTSWGARICTTQADNLGLIIKQPPNTQHGSHAHDKWETQLATDTYQKQ
jgi:hypothetical protein